MLLVGLVRLGMENWGSSEVGRAREEDFRLVSVWGENKVLPSALIGLEVVDGRSSELSCDGMKDAGFVEEGGAGKVGRLRLVG